MPMIITSKRDRVDGSNRGRSKSKNSGFACGFKSRKLPNLLLFIVEMVFLEDGWWVFGKDNGGLDG